MILKIILRYLPLIVVFTLGTILRLYNFNTIPFGLHHDGALEGLEAIELSKTPLPYRPYSQLGWQGESLFRYCLAFLIHFLGPSVWVIKLGSTLFSIFTLFSFYLFAKELFGKRIALFSLFFLAVSGWHIVMGKTVWRAITLPFFETLFFYFLLRFFKFRNYFNALLSGFFLALTLNTYNASRIIPIFAVFAGLLFIYLERPAIKLKNTALKIISSALLFLITIFPLASYAIKNSIIFNSRAQYLFVGNRIKETHSFQPLIDNVKKNSVNV